jgi:hypothetical protein
MVLKYLFLYVRILMYIMPFGNLSYAVYNDNNKLLCCGTYEYCMDIIRYNKPKKKKTVSFNEYVYVY